MQAFYFLIFLNIAAENGGITASNIPFLT